MTDSTHEEAFNLLCDKMIGEGIHRKVFSCRIRDDLVVKVETDNDWREFANAQEMKFWCDNQYAKDVAKWLAPCEYMSPDGRIMLQKRTQPLRDSDKLPDKLPGFLTDVKRDNFGFLNGKLVCHDYAITINTPSLRLKRADWS